MAQADHPLSVGLDMSGINRLGFLPISKRENGPPSTQAFAREDWLDETVFLDNVPAEKIRALYLAARRGDGAAATELATIMLQGRLFHRLRTLRELQAERAVRLLSGLKGFEGGGAPRRGLAKVEASRATSRLSRNHSSQSGASRRRHRR